MTLSPEVEARFTTKLPPHDRRILELLAADCCERACPENPLRLAFAFQEMIGALKYIQEHFIPDYDTVMAQPIIDKDGNPAGFQRGAAVSELLDGLNVVVSMALSKINGTTPEKEMKKARHYKDNR